MAKFLPLQTCTMRFLVLVLTCCGWLPFRCPDIGVLPRCPFWHPASGTASQRRAGRRRCFNLLCRLWRTRRHITYTDSCPRCCAPAAEVLMLLGSLAAQRQR
jgi:hypothetical protein